MLIDTDAFYMFNFASIIYRTGVKLKTGEADNLQIKTSKILKITYHFSLR